MQPPRHQVHNQSDFERYSKNISYQVQFIDRIQTHCDRFRNPYPEFLTLVSVRFSSYAVHRFTVQHIIRCKTLFIRTYSLYMI